MNRSVHAVAACHSSRVLQYAIAYSSSISRRLFRSLFLIRTILCLHSVSCRSRLKLLFIVQCNFVVKTVRTLNKLLSSKVVLSGYFFMLEAESTWGNNVVLNRLAGEQGMHWDKTNKRLPSFKIIVSFVCFAPVQSPVPQAHEWESLRKRNNIRVRIRI